MKSLVRTVCGITALTLGMAGCATRGEPEFGSSVRHMVEGQTYDPAAPRDTVGELDGQKAARAVEGYHAGTKAAAKPPSAVLMPTTQ